MNWTGGVLDRSRNANSSLLAKQKAHFAKARSKLNAGHASPQNIEIFGNIPIRPGISPGKHGKQPSVHIAPSSKEEGSSHRHSHVLELPQHHSSEEVQRFKHQMPTPRTERRRDLPNLNRTSPIVISSRQSPASSFRQDGYISPVGQIQSSSTKPSEDRQASTPTAIEVDRARLLSTGDWVGVSHTKPAKIDFTDTHDKYQIGKRRRLSDIYHRSHTPKRQRYGSPLQRPRYPYAHNDILSQAEISVRIGSAVDRTTARNESQKSAVSKLEHASAVSDEMLLDERYSDRSAASQNPFKERLDIHDYHRLQQPSNHGLTPIVSKSEPQDLSVSIIQDRAIKYNRETYEAQRGTGGFGLGMLPSQPLDDVVHMIQRPGEDNAQINSVVQETPLVQDSSSRSEKGNARKTSLDADCFISGPNKALSRGTEQEPLAVVNVAEENLCTKPRTLHTSSRGLGTRSCFDKLNNSDRMCAHFPDQLQDAVPLPNCWGDHVQSTMPSFDENIAKPPGLACGDVAALDSGLSSEDERDIWKHFINDDPPEQPTGPEIQEPASSILAKVNQPLPVDCATRETSKEQAKTVPEVTDEDEALWRNFVFGGKRFNQDWVFTTVTEGPAANPQDAFSTNPAVQTQPSMEAEVATSPVKQNAHLVEEAARSSPAASMNKVSQIATISNTSQANSDEMLDGEVQNSSSACHSLSHLHTTQVTEATEANTNPPLSNAAQASTSPPTAVDSRRGEITSSSLLVQAPTPAIPVQLSSDELSWSPSRLSQPAAKPLVVFKKPARYGGERSSDAVEPTRLGGKTRPRRSNKRKGAGRKRRGKEPEQLDYWEDEIEDE